MGIVFHDILAVADLLHVQEGEACKRSGASRYFYASLHGAVQWLGTTPGVPSVGNASGTHSQVVERLKNLDPTATAEQKKKGRLMAVNLDAMRMRRVVADYKLPESLTTGEYDTQKAQAERLIGGCGPTP